MIQVSMQGDVAFLHCESALQASRLLSLFMQVLGTDCSAKRDSEIISLRREDLSRVWNLVETEQPTSSTEVQDYLADISNRNHSHAIAREKFYRVLDEQKTSDLSEYWQDTLLEHQAIAANALVTHGLLGACLFDEQGTGKTVVSLATLDTLFNRGDIEQVFVVGPKTLLRNGWKPEIKKFWPERGVSVLEIEGDSFKRAKQYGQASDFYLASFDVSYRDLQLIKNLVERRKTALVVDESYFVKNPESLRGAALEVLAGSAVFRLVLCGTPAPNSPTDIIHQFNLSDLGQTFGYLSKSKLKDLEASEIASAISTSGVMLRRLKSEVLENLPAKQIKINWFDLSPYQRQLYEEAKTEFLLYLKALNQTTFTRDLITYFQRRAALLQICVSPNLLGDPVVASGKYDAVFERVRDLLLNEPHRKILIWSAYTKSTSHLLDILRDFGAIRLDGTLNSDAKQAALKSFQSDSSIRILIGNPSAAGAGLNLVQADTAIYVSHSNQAAPFMQSLDRIHRIGQQADVVTYEFFSAKGTIEGREIDALLRKQIRQAELLNDSDQDLNLEEVIRELEAQ